MVRTTEIKRCPHCGKPYECSTDTGKASKYTKLKYASPLKQCGCCKKLFLDRAYREIAVEGIWEQDMVRVSPSTWVYSAIGVFAGITAFSHSILLAAILIGASIYMVLQELLTYDKRQKKLEDERRASEERLKNPACAALLKRLGYPQIPGAGAAGRSVQAERNKRRWAELDSPSAASSGTQRRTVLS